MINSILNLLRKIKTGLARSYKSMYLLSLASRIFGMRWAARHLVAQIDRSGWKDGRPTVLCLRREQFSKDIEALRSRCDINFVCLNETSLGRMQKFWVSQEFRKQTLYQKCKGQKYSKDWANIERFADLVLAEAEHVIRIDAVMAANMDYWQSAGMRLATKKHALPFLVLCREHFNRVCQHQMVLDYYSDFVFEGDSVAVFGESTRQGFVKSGACQENQVVVTGAPRLDAWHDIDRSSPASDCNLIVLLTYSGYGVEESFRTVLDLFVDHAEAALGQSETQFVIKAKSARNALLTRRMLKSHPSNLSIRVNDSFYDLLPRTRLLIGFDSLALLDGLLSETEIVIPMWGVADKDPDFLMFHPSRPKQEKAITFARSPATITDKIAVAIEGKQDCHQDREARIATVQQLMDWSPTETASAKVEAWIRSRIAASRNGHAEPRA